MFQPNFSVYLTLNLDKTFPDAVDTEGVKKMASLATFNFFSMTFLNLFFGVNVAVTLKNNEVAFVVVYVMLFDNM